MLRLPAIVLTVFILMGCGSPKQKDGQSSNKGTYAFVGSYSSNAKAIVSIQTYDHYTRRLNSGYGFYIDKDLIVTNLDLIKGCYKVKVAPMDGDDFTEIKGFIAYDFNLNLVLLKTFRNHPHHLSLSSGIASADSVYTLFRKDKKLFVQNSDVQETIDRDTVSYSGVSDGMMPGKPAFCQTHQLSGMLQRRALDGDTQMVVLAHTWITQLQKQASTRVQAVYDLRTKTNKVYPSYKLIQGFRIITDRGNIEVRLFDETPAYRDNFIKLVSDHYFDSLLVHRVLRSFLIQTGAGDTRYAGKDDVVGWQGPGYTLAMDVQPQIFHWRGAMAASKLPADRNPKNRSDGSQFYLVSGRLFSGSELDDIEKQTGKKFSAQQRKIYSTVGGAPHLDGDYTVFGEVTSGMDVVDKIAEVETYAIDRPLDDIRIRTIEIIKK